MRELASGISRPFGPLPLNGSVAKPNSDIGSPLSKYSFEPIRCFVLSLGRRVGGLGPPAALEGDHSQYQHNIASVSRQRDGGTWMTFQAGTLFT